MIVQCPKCKTKYRMDDELVRDGGTQVRCSRCKAVFEVPSEEPAPEIVEAGKGEEEDFLGLGRGERSNQVKPSEPAVEEPSISARLGLGNEDLDEEDRGNGEDRSDHGPEKSSKRGRTAALLLILVLVLLAAGVYYFYPQVQPFIPASIAQRIAATTSDHGFLRKEEPGSDVENINLVDVRQYFVANDKIGQLFVIEGRAVNGYSTPKELIRLQASLYDGLGNVIESKQFLCGNTVTLFQLQVLTIDELETALNSKVGVLTNNTNVQPGGEVQFMTVFARPPENVQEFGVRVIDIREPSRR
jgi:predicted Zn finger-like uncharacterized protein